MAQLPKSLLVDLGGWRLRVVHGGQHQILKHLDVFLRHDLGIDLQRLQLLVPVDDDGHHAAAGGGLDLHVAHLALQRLLHLLRLLHHFLDVHRCDLC